LVFLALPYVSDILHLITMLGCFFVLRNNRFVMISSEYHSPQFLVKYPREHPLCSQRSIRDTV